MNYEEVIEVVAALVSLMMLIGLVALSFAMLIGLVALSFAMWLIGLMELGMGQPVGILYWLIGGIVLWVALVPMGDSAMSR